ncbi:nitroreductase family protein [Streptomyces sp. NPDC048415]|uniref:nitroreductase family protein n=1 Tax=Streptomyces sp. NPDC048415 TaxID=3154822 RepID=UPI00343D7C45
MYPVPARQACPGVYEAVTSRRAVRAFTDRPVPRQVLERVLSAAAWAPSGSNLQPWRAYVVTGGPLAEIKRRAGERVASGDPWDEWELSSTPGSTTLLQSTDDFQTAIHQAVEQAETSVLIMTPEIDSTGVRAWEPRLKA